jgi:hypothetical protein
MHVRWTSLGGVHCAPDAHRGGARHARGAVHEHAAPGHARRVVRARLVDEREAAREGCNKVLLWDVVDLDVQVLEQLRVGRPQPLPDLDPAPCVSAKMQETCS